MTVKNFPELKFDSGYNSSVSLAVLSAHARTDQVRVHNDGLDATGKLVLRFELPGMKSIVKRTHAR